MTRTDRHAEQRNRATAVAHRAAQEASGLFLRADELASLQYHLRRDGAGIAGDLARHVSWLLDQRGIEPPELRAAHAFKRPLTPEEVDRHPSAACSQCSSQSMEIGGGYRECLRCGHGWLNVAPDDVALGANTA
jgi:hypothetical protein